MVVECVAVLLLHPIRSQVRSGLGQCATYVVQSNALLVSSDVVRYFMWMNIERRLAEDDKHNMQNMPMAHARPQSHRTQEG